MTSLALSERNIGPEEPVYIIAEAGVNHNGQLSAARQLVYKAAGAGADAIKFQMFKTDSLVSEEATLTEQQKKGTEGNIESQRNMLGRLELPLRAFEELQKLAHDQGLDFFATPYDPESLSLLLSLDVPVIKIGSGDVTFHQFLEAVAQTGRPTILSTGMATMEEIDAAVDLFRNDEGIPESLLIMYCVSLYPTVDDQLDMRTITTFQERYDVPIGFSDHTTDHLASETAVALGACVLEKHITLQRSDEGPDHRASLEPESFHEFVKRIRRVESVLGEGTKAISDEEKQVREKARRSVAVTRTMEEGEEISETDLTALRPEKGISADAYQRVIGKTLQNEKKAGEILREDDLN